VVRSAAETEVARAVALDQWAVVDPLALHAYPGGKSRRTWRVGTQAWLTASFDADELDREQSLLIALGERIAGLSLSCRVPEPIPTADGKLVAVGEGFSWRMTRYLFGARPDDNRLETHLASARCLESMHRLLRQMQPELAVEQPDFGALSGLVEESLEGDWRTLTTDVGEREAVIGMADWLRPRLASLEDVPRQLIHGDWSTPNLLVADGARTHVVGVLDWQFASVGPPTDDVAAIASTILMWSTIADKRAAIEEVIRAYGHGSDLRIVGVAMGAYWLRNYWRGRKELQRETLAQAMVDRQPGRLRSVLSFVTEL
jgi:Ser/Thr protein kinase RdoA (MazF antagonist)